MKADRASGAGLTSRAVLGPEGVKRQLRAINPNYKDHPKYAETQARKAALWTEEKRQAQSDEMKAKWAQPEHWKVRPDLADGRDITRRRR